MSLLLKKKLRTTVGGLFLLYHYRKIKAWGTSTLKENTIRFSKKSQIYFILLRFQKNLYG